MSEYAMLWNKNKNPMFVGDLTPEELDFLSDNIRKECSTQNKKDQSSEHCSHKETSEESKSP